MLLNSAPEIKLCTVVGGRDGGGVTLKASLQLPEGVKCPWQKGLGGKAARLHPAAACHTAVRKVPMPQSVQNRKEFYKGTGVLYTQPGFSNIAFTQLRKEVVLEFCISGCLVY